MGSILNKTFAVICFFVMLLSSYIIGTKIMDLISITDNTVVQWIMYLSLFVSIGLGTFIIPIIIAISDNDINPLNGIIALMWTLMMIPILFILTGFVWDLAYDILGPTGWSTTTGGSEGGLTLIIIQLLIIGIVIILAYIAPIAITLQTEPVTQVIQNE